MSRIRLYLDEDSMDTPIVSALRARGVDVLTVREANMRGCVDDEQIAFAVAAGRTLLTFNQCDFARLHQKWLEEGRTHAGIIVAPQQRYSVGESLRRILALLSALSAEEMHDRLEFLSSWSS